MAKITITTIQTDLHWEDKAANLAMFEQKILSIADKTELIVLPEMFTTGFTMKPALFAETMDGPSVQWMKQMARQKRVVLTGSMIIESEGFFFNRLIWMQPNGAFGYYDKRHLFAYGGEDMHYCAGKKRFIASVNGWRINLQICYDLRFPVWTRQSPNADRVPEFDLLVVVANWPERRSNAWKILLQARAIENQCYVIGLNRVGLDGANINYSGDSMIVDPGGEILYQQANAEALITHELDKEVLDQIRIHYPFLRDADHFFIDLS